MDEEKAYRIYMTDSMKAAYSLNARYADLILPQSAAADDRTAEEIIDGVSAKIRELGS